MDDTPGRTTELPPPPDATAESARELLIDQLALVDRLTAHVCRRRRLSPDEAEEFASHVRLKFVENDYAILKSFRHRCSLRTFLHIVIERLLLDYRTALWGRWRPSVRAREIGPAGVLLDRLMNRDGLSFDEACATMQTTYAMTISRSDLYAMSVRLPSRPRRRVVAESVEDVVSSGNRPDDHLIRAEARRLATQLKGVLKAAITQLTPAERELIEMRYREGRPVSDMARALGEPAKPLYRRIEQIVQKLRRPVRAAGGRLADADAFRTGEVSISW